jgi:hypothetical protein
MFPYATINASLMLRNSENKREPNPSLVSTLSQYTQMPTEDFYNLIVKKSEVVGFFEMVDMITKWQDFDNLSYKQKIRFVNETIQPDYYSIKNRFKRLLKK